MAMALLDHHHQHAKNYPVIEQVKSAAERFAGNNVAVFDSLERRLSGVKEGRQMAKAHTCKVVCVALSSTNGKGLGAKPVDGGAPKLAQRGNVGNVRCTQIAPSL